MGASDWNYIVPFQPDINQALQELRQRVFQLGAYYKPAEFRERFLDLQPEGLRGRPEESIRQLKPLPRPASIAELIEQNGEQGTHSTIDIERVDTEPGIGLAWHLRDDELIAVFGTTQPTREMVAEKEAQRRLAHYRQRGEALHIIVFQDGQPSEIFFRSCSGD